MSILILRFCAHRASMTRRSLKIIPQDNKIKHSFSLFSGNRYLAGIRHSSGFMRMQFGVCALLWYSTVVRGGIGALPLQRGLHGW